MNTRKEYIALNGVRHSEVELCNMIIESDRSIAALHNNVGYLSELLKTMKEDMNKMSEEITLLKDRGRRQEEIVKLVLPKITMPPHSPQRIVNDNTSSKMRRYEHDTGLTGCDGMRETPLGEYVLYSEHEKLLEQKQKTTTLKQVEPNNPMLAMLATECCGVGPITDENYCSKCGARIVR